MKETITMSHTEQRLIESAEPETDEVPAAPLTLRQPSHLPEHIRADAQSDRLAPALWLGTRVSRFRSLVEHPESTGSQSRRKVQVRALRRRWAHVRTRS